MKKIIKRFFILFLCLTLSIASYTKQRANAVALVDDLVVSGGITVSTGAIVALAGTTLVAGGVYLDSTLNDSNVSKYVVSKMIETGNAMNYWGVRTYENGKQFLTWTADGISSFLDFVADTISSGVPVSGSVGTFESVKGSVLTVYSTNGTKWIEHTSRYDEGYYDVTYNGSEFAIVFHLPSLDYVQNVCSASSSVCLQWDYSFNGQSVCAPVSSSLRDFNNVNASDVIGSSSVANDGSVCYQPSIGVPLENSPPLDGGGVGVLNPSIDFPYGKTWDDLYPDISIPKDTDTGTDVPDIDVPSDTVFDKVIDSIKDLTDSIADSIDKIFDMPVGDTPSLDFAPLMIATMKFPFCIPWDLFRCVEVFNSGEETFKYEFKEVKYSDTDIIIIPNFKVDFSTIPYVDTLRKVFKFIMYISYCVFLICKIRGLIRS